MPPQTGPARSPGETLLLAISPHQDTASEIETRLRNAGRNVRVDWLDKPANLENYLASHAPALFCCHAFENGVDSSEALLRRCLDLRPDIPVMLLDEIEVGARAQLMRDGARDVIAPRDTEHLAAALIRELDAVKHHTEAEHHRRRAEQMEERLQALLAESEDARATIQEGIHAQLNPSYARLFGFESPEDLEGVPLMDLVAPADRDPVKKKLAACRKGKGGDEPIRFTGRRADDSQCSIQIQCASVEFEGEAAVEIRIPQARHQMPQGSAEARSALHRALARSDIDTNADTVGESTGGLYFITVDELYGLQERLGLARADTVLDELALFLLDALEPGDQCFRFGAAEYVVIGTRASMEKLQSTAEKLRASIDDQVFGDEDMSASLTVSIAINVLSEDLDRDALLLRAMRRAHETSAEGGNKVTLETTPEGRPSEEPADRDWFDLIKDGLERDRFTFAYQSIASLEGNDAEHFDVILRLIGENGEILHPQQFVDSANRHNLLPEIDRLVISKILTLLSQRRKRGIPGMFFVKLSGATLDQAPQFLEWLRANLAERQVQPGELRLSLTEDVMRGNIRRAQQLAKGLKALGLALTLEQFGTTGKSIQILDRVPVEFAKLDTETTEALAGDDSDPRIVEAVEAARERNVRLIAQQVADANTMARLWQVGISYVQGQFVQEPESDSTDGNSGINVA